MNALQPLDVQEWREERLKLALRIFLKLVTPEQQSEFWRRYDRHKVLLPPPPGCVEGPNESQLPPEDAS